MMKGRPGHEGTSDGRWIGMMVEFALGEDMPDDDEQFTGDSGNGLGFAKAVTQGLE